MTSIKKIVEAVKAAQAHSVWGELEMNLSDKNLLNQIKTAQNRAEMVEALFAFQAFVQSPVTKGRRWEHRHTEAVAWEGKIRELLLTRKVNEKAMEAIKRLIAYIPEDRKGWARHGLDYGRFMQEANGLLEAIKKPRKNKKLVEEISTNILLTCQLYDRDKVVELQVKGQAPVEEIPQKIFDLLGVEEEVVEETPTTSEPLETIGAAKPHAVRAMESMAIVRETPLNEEGNRKRGKKARKRAQRAALVTGRIRA